MADESRLTMADFEAEGARQKKRYWDELVAAGDPDATTKHNAFCADIDQIVRNTVATAATLEQLFQLTRDTMINMAIAYDRGDHEEVARLSAEHDKLLGS